MVKASFKFKLFHLFELLIPVLTFNWSLIGFAGRRVVFGVKALVVLFQKVVPSK